MDAAAKQLEIPSLFRMQEARSPSRKSWQTLRKGPSVEVWRSMIALGRFEFTAYGSEYGGKSQDAGCLQVCEVVGSRMCAGSPRRSAKLVQGCSSFVVLGKQVHH